MNVAFVDSSVHEHISKMIIYATHNILTEEDSPLGHLLLHCVRLYLEVNMYAAFEVHTTDAISEGRGAVQALTAFMKQYITATDQEDGKNWSFPKLYMTTHLFDDIKAKGATRNYNTKPNEQMHGPLKDLYQDLSTHMVLPQAEFFLVTSIIRGALLVHDETLDYFVIDTVDTDMFLHLKEMHLQAGHVVHI
ncbi:uncharacterized protein EDB93DRAFT_1248116 [Suillus bovinus]|uniref:uncharacterized protein n=1 Tax=Suillus bovinus TaxID=48563 RepID=UPI001B87325D|nr:uncharacterized protein EDB93DRAFT_1248116 [Suillus bovinus]KAG2155158.1 hypothetical protein EDB93DRAFT_1248116 [Suillus bovinus]